ncbi:MAG: 4-hydroxy-tetrahydrodipicolinate reductase [Bacteroidetes bacterium]|nr:4-hydroxy-tetrahydrodipicolinate reductase [Bacteroidota bacterium]MBK9672103.1 4-hydroxy-tetrahydrodipicolinate reductase [Bacteroidota bacterium]MBP6411988.1 4-hydroxy-tetrahydrodipicolinate reductase [Bacteroidia bacterium]
MNIALIGYGKMGKEIESIALQRGHNLVAIYSSNKTISTEILKTQAIDCAIEFTKPEAAVANIEHCFAANIPVVVGTTGWYQKLNHVKQLCSEQNQALLYASNFSLGVTIFFELNKKLAQLMQEYPNYEVSMQEIHHLQKLDAPSGTAITLANDLLDILPNKTKWVNKVSKLKNEIGIESLRIEGIPGTHSISYSSEIDSIQIKHTAHNRKGFALGAVIAAEWLINKKGVHEMKHVLGYA